MSEQMSENSKIEDEKQRQERQRKWAEQKLHEALNYKSFLDNILNKYLWSKNDEASDMG